MPRGRRRVGREQPPEVAEPGRPEQGVGDRMERDVAVGMAVEPGAPAISMPPRASGSPGPNGWLSWPKPMRGRPAPAERRSAGRGRRAAVTLRLVGSPGIAWTGILQASSRAASSVKVAGAVGGNAAERLAEEVAPRRPAGSGPPRARAGRPSPRSARPSIRLTVSATGTTGIAAPWRRPPRRPPRRASGETHGRAPSWTRTTRSPTGPARPSSASRRRRRRRPNPGAGAAGDDASTPRQPRPPRQLARRGRRGDDDDPLDPGAAAIAASVQASSGRPPIGAMSLSMPAHPPRRPARDDDRRRRGAPCRRPPRQSSRGWAKIIRPATVCRTRVTVTSRSGR